MTTSNHTSEIPFGYCQCGCGHKTPLASNTNHRRNQIKGNPTRFIIGHQNRIRVDIAEHFWLNVDKSGGDDACWIWQMQLMPNGYGRIRAHGKDVYAHRFTYETTYGAIPQGLEVCHNCPDGDNRSCVNPSHLFVGTHLENVQDCVNKNRTAKGEGHGRHKLTVDQVKSVRDRYSSGGILQRELAAEMGVTPSLIGLIVRRKKWQHVE